MKKYMTICILTICMLSLIGCSKKENDDILHLGLNAEIIEVDASNNILYVAGVDENSNEIFGGRCAIDCNKAINKQKIFYVNYDSEDDVNTIQFEDFIVGDNIILGIYDNELNNNPSDVIVAEQVQLGTQRFN